MFKNNSQKGAIEISAIAAIVIIAAITAAVSIYVTSKYYEGLVIAKPPVVATPKTTPKITPTPATNETADWQTYTNKEYEFEVKYPINYSILKPGTGDSKESVRLDSDVSFKNTKIEYLYEIDFADTQKTNNQDSLIITIYNNGNNYTLENWLEKYSETLPTNASLGVEEEIRIDGIKGFKGGFGCCMTSRHSVFLKKDDKIYEISSGFKNFETGLYTNEEMFNQILSTFRFTK